MELLNDDISKLEIGKSMESFQKYMDLQRDLFHSQIEQMQRIVVSQCKLTGVNPLAQEMAAGALSIKIGKRPRDLLNPKAVKYMQSVFSIKDAISKKESREISALFGVKLTQVREFFNTQRSRVRRLVRLSNEKSIGSNACKEQDDGVGTSCEPTMPIDPVPLNSIGPAPVEDGPSCSTQDNNLPGIDDLDKEFVQNIFNLMRKEETFSGQVKLLEWILQIQDSSVLCWFLTNGGVMILATWLSQAAIEEQTTVLHIILKVLCHLPLHKSLPVHMSAVLQSVNKLRFYRNADISNRAKVLLSRWSKLFARTQALKKPNGSKALSDSQTELILRQSIGEIMHDQHWQSNIDVIEDIATPSPGSSESSRKLESHQALKLLTASSDDSNRKNLLGVSRILEKIRKRRKVQMVEQPGQTTGARSLQAPKFASLNQGRPLSADDIQKAKMRAQFMQSKYGKTVPPNGNAETKTESLIRHLVPSSLPSVSKVPSHLNYPEVEELKMPQRPPLEATNQVETPSDPQIKEEFQELLMDNCTKFQIPWRTPPEMKLNDIWRVGAGENSKENEAQCNRNRREKEVFYEKFLDIPSNPKDPWDIEMDYDDSLTVEILTEQLPDAEGAEKLLIENQAVNIVPSVPPPSLDVNLGTAEPDLELLAVLLKNPELVFALTSGQAGNLSSGETVKLLDLIKTGGSASMNGLNGFGKKDQEKVEVSLPSPTPSSNAGTSGWKSEASKNPFSQHSLSNQVANFRTDSLSSVLPHNPAINISQNQHPTTMAPFSHHFVAPKTQFPPQQSTNLPERLPVSAVHTLHPNHYTNPPTLQMAELLMPVKNVPSTSFPFFSQSASPSHRVEAAAKSKPITSNLPDRSALSFQLPVHSEPQSITPGLSTHLNSQLQGLDSWRGMHGIVPSLHSQAKRNEFDASNGGRTVQLHIPPANFERNQYAKEDEFESWSPENSPVRIPEYMHQQNSRMYRPVQARDPDPSRFREENRTGKGWRDRR